jgi:transcriptional regulator with XRE-family HTH domain
MMSMPKNDELQKETMRVLSELGTPQKPLSARAAGEKLNIGYNQIADMAKGKSPGEKTLIKFAGALGESPADWLRYAGKHDFAKNISSESASEIQPEQHLVQQILRELAEVPLERQSLLRKQILALIRVARSED